jgi:hypothetical protein
MGVYLQAVDGPDIDSPDYVGTFGSSQSHVILQLLRHHRSEVESSTDPKQGLVARGLVRRRLEYYHNTGRTIHCIEWFKIIDAVAPKDTYEFRKYAIDRGVTEWLRVSEYDDDAVASVRAAIAKIAEYGQDVYET